MLTKITIRNFKRFRNVEVELGNPVVFIGPNNSGKTTALQALALWSIGLQRWREKRANKPSPEKRPGVTINRRDLVAVPIPDANLLWHDLHVRQRTENIRIEIIVEGVDSGEHWICGLEFDYANEESFYCRPLRDGENRMHVPEKAFNAKISFLPPMSGLAANETRLDPGAINVRIGEGRTAEVLRNLCYQIFLGENGEQNWDVLTKQINNLFGVCLDKPIYVAERGEIIMSYRTPSGRQLDLSTSGRGLQQMILLLAHLALNPRTTLLLDEPDAHLEILRQRQLYQVLTDTAKSMGSQIVAASHSEVILNEAADRDVVVAFVGKPHRIDDRGMQVLKSLKDIGFDQYYLAEQKGWVLYLEGSTDLAILHSFSKKLNHPAQMILEQPFTHYVRNQPQRVREHFYGLQEAKSDLLGIALFDRINKVLDDDSRIKWRMWSRNEIENYLCYPEVLEAWVRDLAKDQGPLFQIDWQKILESSISEIENALSVINNSTPWSHNTKVSDEFLTPLFRIFFDKIGMPNLMRKTDFHVLAQYVPDNKIDPEIIAVLDLIKEIADQASPAKII